ncbi:MAG: transporter substrate-binding domain-containing protein [bacterium]|nr:transporter substrate-binding domain-containing protein [Hyphomicrobiales bacterium]MCP4622211.1 transporter substrate-binding domain-containing protein [bacterium]
MEGEKIALVRGYASHEQIAKEFSGIETFWYARPLYALRAVSTGRADADIGSQGPASYLVSQHAMTNLKVAAIYDDSPAGQRFAVREDWPEMVDIPNKTLETITDSDASTIHNRWINVRFERQFDWMLVFGDYARGILADRQ